MITMDQIHNIRNRYYAKGDNISQISSTMKLDRKTVRKYVEKDDWNKQLPKPITERRFCPKLDNFKLTIDEWLEGDKKAKRKQRHTAQRVFNRLCEEFPIRSTAHTEPLPRISSSEEVKYSATCLKASCRWSTNPVKLRSTSGMYSSLRKASYTTVNILSCPFRTVIKDTFSCSMAKTWNAFWKV